MFQTAPAPQALWIWPRGTLYLSNSYAGFRHDFDMDTLPAKAPFVITADQSYKLHVNGRYVCRGPVRGVQENWHYDTVDLLPYLKTGHNWIAVEAYNPGKSTYFYNHKGTAGLLCSGVWDNGINIFSNTSDWQIFRNTAYNHNTAQLSAQMGQMEELDLRFDDRSWITQEKDFKLPPCMPDAAPTAKIQGALPWTNLSPRPLPLLDESCRTPEKVTASGIGSNAVLPQRAPGLIPNITADFVDFELDTIRSDLDTICSAQENGYLKFTLPASGEGNFSVAVVDLGALSWLPGVPLFEIGTHESGTVLDVFYNQYMPDGKISYSWHPAKGCQIALASRVHLNGTTHKFELFQVMGVRHAVLVLRENTSPVEIKLAWRSAVFPLEIKGNFFCSDPVINEIYNISVHTQKVCALDAFVDTPWREQSQWWGDARVQAKNTFFLTGDSQLLKQGISSIAEQKNPLGLTFANAPTTDSGPILPDFCLTWIITLRDYWFQTGDASLVKKHKAQADAIIAYFESIRNSHGLIQYDPRFWLFEDWSSLPKRNTPTFINLWYIYARQMYCEVLEAAGFNPCAEQLKQQIEADRKRVANLLFDPEQQLFLPELDADGKLTGPASVHDQVLALLLNLIPEANSSMINKVVLPCLKGTYTQGAVPSSFWATYLLDCALEYNLREEAINYIKTNWHSMIPAGTVWENFPNPNPGDLSCAHAWSAHLISHLPELVFGFKQLSPGWTDIEFDPHNMPDLANAEFSIPLPLGKLSCSFIGKNKDFHCNIPSGIRAILRGYGEDIVLN